MWLVRRAIAIVIAGFALLICLYGLFDQKTEISTRILGAVLIAAIAFFLIRWLWPRQRKRRRNKAVTRREDLGNGITLETTEQPIYNHGATLPRGAFREYWIEYANAEGEISERDIYVLSVDPGGEMVKAWCFEANDIRSFRSDRVQRAKHLRSGKRVEHLGRDYLEQN